MRYTEQNRIKMNHKNFISCENIMYIFILKYREIHTTYKKHRNKEILKIFITNKIFLCKEIKKYCETK